MDTDSNWDTVDRMGWPSDMEPTLVDREQGLRDNVAVDEAGVGGGGGAGAFGAMAVRGGMASFAASVAPNQLQRAPVVALGD